VPFSMEKAKQNVLKVKPDMKIIELSCTNGEGLEIWYNWLQSKVLQPEEF